MSYYSSRRDKVAQWFSNAGSSNGRMAGDNQDNMGSTPIPAIKLKLNPLELDGLSPSEIEDWKDWLYATSHDLEGVLEYLDDIASIRRILNPLEHT